MTIVNSSRTNAVSRFVKQFDHLFRPAGGVFGTVQVSFLSPIFRRFLRTEFAGTDIVENVFLNDVPQ